ncbi:MAG: sugar phosphate isomerase/epimerase [Candidatus Methylacidiphilales bacterium]|nr:sugar phosphate isomerase/epimerase [Candidatus Methylacidiphilales bacterium]
MKPQPCLAFSNIAWSPEEDLPAYDLLGKLGVSQVECAPGRLWPQPAEATDVEVRQALGPIVARGLSVSGFQAILYQKSELLLFDDQTRPRLMEHLKGLARVCAMVGGRYLVFGAPKNRWVPDSLDASSARREAVDFFRELGREAAGLGVVFGMEANPASYGCNFCTHVADTVGLVREVDSPGFRWHLDAGELAMNAEKLPETILEHAPWVGSVHVSEANLDGFASPWEGHAKVARCLEQIGYAGTLSIEMKRQPAGLESVREAVEHVSRIYLP